MLQESIKYIINSRYSALVKLGASDSALMLTMCALQMLVLLLLLLLLLMHCNIFQPFRSTFTLFSPY